MYDRFLAFITPFCQNHPGLPVNGEYYDLPDETVYTTSSMQLPAKGRIEVNTIAPGAPADFEWEYELTIKDKVDDHFVHMIIRHDKSVVETYGKTIIDVTEDRAAEILKLLKDLQSSATD